MTIKEFLNSPCEIYCWENRTWREWFKDVLATFLKEGEGFSGKRPNCNSGWQEDLAAGLANINPGVVKSWEQDERGHVPYEVNWEMYNEMCKEVVEELFSV